MSNNYWPYLKENDIVDIIAPAYGIAVESIQVALSKVKTFVHSLGLIPRIKENIITPESHPFCANTKDNRANSLIEALKATDSKAIWCLRGGYGCTHLLDSLEDAPPLAPKLLIGFSDITALHLYLNQKWNWSTLHARVLWQFINDSKHNEDSVEEIKSIIFGKRQSVTYPLIPLNNAAKAMQTNIYGHVIGGNITLLQNSIGTPWQLDGKNKIIFFEEVDERGYAIDRLLYHFKQTRILDEAKAIIFGDITYKGVNKEKEDELIRKAMYNFANLINKPVFTVKGIGHGDANHPLPFLTDSTIELTNSEYLLTCQTGGATI